MAEQKITLKVARKPYSLTIDSDKEEIYRLAEREVNAYIGKWEEAFGDNINIQDCLVFTALQFCINNITITRQNGISDEDIEALERKLVCTMRQGYTRKPMQPFGPKF